MKMPSLTDITETQNDFMELHHMLKDDAVKMYKTMKKLMEVKQKSLIAPNGLPSNQAMGYASGSKDAFKRVGDMAEFVLNDLQFDFGKLADEQKETLQPDAQKLE